MEFQIFNNTYMQDKILELFNSVFQKTMTDSYYQWRYGMFSKSFHSVALIDDQIIGHVAAQSLPILIYGDTVNALFLMDGMVHPDFRGKEIFSKILLNLYKVINPFQYPFTFGFSNKNAASTHFKKTNMVNLGHPSEIEIQVNNLNSDYGESSLIIPIGEFDPKWDSIWKSSLKNMISVSRTSNYLNWRYVEHPLYQYENYPLFHYEKFILLENKIPKAYFILKSFNEKLHLIDYGGSLNQTSFNDILQFSLKIAQNKGLDLFTFWQSNRINYDLSRMLPIKKQDALPFIGITQLDPKLLSIHNVKNWNFTMGDSDVF